MRRSAGRSFVRLSERLPRRAVPPGIMMRSFFPLDLTSTARRAFKEGRGSENGNSETRLCGRLSSSPALSSPSPCTDLSRSLIGSFSFLSPCPCPHPFFSRPALVPRLPKTAHISPSPLQPPTTIIASMNYPAIAPAATLPPLDSNLPTYNSDVLIAVPADQVEGNGELKEKGRNWVS